MARDCVFCRIIRGELPAVKIYEDEYVVVFLDKYPINPGHTLIVPRRHAERLDELSDEEATALIRVAKWLAPRIVKAVDADGYNVVTNNGRAAGQVIFHVHLHVIPRFHGDGCRFDCKRNTPSYRELAEIGEKIRKELGVSH